MGNKQATFAAQKQIAALTANTNLNNLYITGIVKPALATFAAPQSARWYRAQVLLNLPTPCSVAAYFAAAKAHMQQLYNNPATQWRSKPKSLATAQSINAKNIVALMAAGAITVTASAPAKAAPAKGKGAGKTKAA